LNQIQIYSINFCLYFVPERVYTRQYSSSIWERWYFCCPFGVGTERYKVTFVSSFRHFHDSIFTHWKMESTLLFFYSSLALSLFLPFSSSQIMQGNSFFSVLYITLSFPSFHVSLQCPKLFFFMKNLYFS
jgi:hypothetical protein